MKRLALAALACLAAAPASGYDGKYQYIYAGGTNGEATLLYVLNLGGGCRLQIAGYDANQALLCTPVEKDGRTDFQFAGFADGSLTTPDGKRPYRPGQTLFSFTTTTSGETATQWGALRPGGKRLPTGVYFSPQP